MSPSVRKQDVVVGWIQMSPMRVKEVKRERKGKQIWKKKSHHSVSHNKICDTFAHCVTNFTRDQISARKETISNVKDQNVSDDLVVLELSAFSEEDWSLKLPALFYTYKNTSGHGV